MKAPALLPKGKVVRFNYAVLKPDVRQLVEEHTKAVHSLLSRTADSIIEIGKRLLDVHRQIAPGQFTAWLAAEFSWSIRTARRFMHVAERFTGLDCLGQFRPSALYELAAPRSGNEEAIDRCIDLARKGQVITGKLAHQLVHCSNGSAKSSPPPNMLAKVRYFIREVARKLQPAERDVLAGELIALADEIRSPGLAKAEAN